MLLELVLEIIGERLVHLLELLHLSLLDIVLWELEIGFRNIN